jgi:hypothetical protein
LRCGQTSARPRPKGSNNGFCGILRCLPPCRFAFQLAHL